MTLMKLQDRNMISAEEIYQDLRNKIENLEYMPGDPVSENELCAVYNCTRHFVRGAFAKLKELRLLEVYPQRGSFVSLIDLEYISDILYMRESVESNAILKIMRDPELTRKTCAEMRRWIERQRKYENDTVVTKEYAVLDDSFHKTLLEAIGKQDVTHLLDYQYIHLRRWRNLETAATRTVGQFIKEHERIVTAMEEGNREKALDTLHKHLDTIDESRKQLEKDGKSYFVK